jgi:hypothetical protein
MITLKIDDPVSGECGSASRCLLCGEVLDAIIRANRKRHDEPTPSRARLPIVSC